MAPPRSDDLQNRRLGWALLAKFAFPAIALISSLFYQRYHTKHSLSSLVGKRNQHVVVVGGGLAGLSATVEALISGAKVTLIDKHKLGGNSAKATSGINAVLTRHQLSAQIDDSIEGFVEDILRSGQGKTDRSLAHTLSSKSSDAVNFLEGILGRELSNVAMLGGHSKARTHRLETPAGSKPIPIGFVTISALKKFLNDPKWAAQLEILEGTNVTAFQLSDTSRVVGLQARTKEGVEVSFNPDAVVLSSGGFSAALGSGGLVGRFNAKIGEWPYTTNGGFATGDLLKIGLDLGIDSKDLDEIQLHPTSFVDPNNAEVKEKFLCPEVVRGVGALLFDRGGRRFVNELERRDVVSQAIIKRGSTASAWGMKSEDASTRVALLLMNAEIRMKVGESVFDFYKARNLIRDLGTLEQASETLGFELSTFKESLNSYERAANEEEKDFFDKTSFPTKFDLSENLFGAFITPAVHYTMGGLQINSEAQLLKHSNPILNLFAAGEVSGGLHGSNRLGGNGMLESVVFGRIAGKNAARIGSSQYLQNPLNRKSATEMSVREVLHHSSHLSTLRLSFPALHQTAEFDIGQRVLLSSSINSRKHACSSDMAVRDVAMVAAMKGTLLGFVDFLLLDSEMDRILKSLHPGDSVELRLDEVHLNSSRLLSGRSGSVVEIVALAESEAVNTLAQIVGEERGMKVKIVLFETKGMNIEGLSEILMERNSKVSLNVVVVDDIAKPLKFLLDESNVVMETTLKHGLQF